MTSDPLLDQLNRLQDRIRAGKQRFRQQRGTSTVGHIQKDVTAFHIFLYQVLRALLWIREKILAPVFRFLMKPVRWLWHQYRRLWDWVVSYKDEFGEVRYSKVRGGLMVLATIWALFAVDDVAEFVADAGLYAVTAHHSEEIYLFKSQELTGATKRDGMNTFNTTGCHLMPCSDRESVYFRVRPNLFNHAWALVHSGNIFFPESVAAAVPPGQSKCTITSYGVRIKFVMRNLEVYPDLLAVNCRPIPTNNAVAYSPAVV